MYKYVVRKIWIQFHPIIFSIVPLSVKSGTVYFCPPILWALVLGFFFFLSRGNWSRVYVVKEKKRSLETILVSFSFLLHEYNVIGKIVKLPWVIFYFFFMNVSRNSSMIWRPKVSFWGETISVDLIIGHVWNKKKMR